MSTTSLEDTRERLLVLLDVLCSRVNGDFMRNKPIDEAADKILTLATNLARDTKVSCMWCSDMWASHAKDEWRYCPWCGGNFAQNGYKKEEK